MRFQTRGIVPMTAPRLARAWQDETY